MVEYSLVVVIYVSAPFNLESTSVFFLARRGSSPEGSSLTMMWDISGVPLLCRQEESTHSSTASPSGLLYTRTRYAERCMRAVAFGETFPPQRLRRFVKWFC